MFLKNHTQNVMDKLLTDPFPKSQNLAYFWINSARVYTACFYCMIS